MPSFSITPGGPITVDGTVRYETQPMGSQPISTQPVGGSSLESMLSSLVGPQRQINPMLAKLPETVVNYGMNAAKRAFEAGQRAITGNAAQTFMKLQDRANTAGLEALVAGGKVGMGLEDIASNDYWNRLKLLASLYNKPSSWSNVIGGTSRSSSGVTKVNDGGNFYPMGVPTGMTSKQRDAIIYGNQSQGGNSGQTDSGW